MVVEMSRISKANICPYKGSEIPDADKLGLIPDRIYRLFRDPKELEKGASTFDGKPLLIRHVPITAELPNQSLWVGTVGKCTFEAPYLVTRPLTVITAAAQSLVEADEQRELSAGYRYDAEMVPGVYGGEQYDGRMVNIRGNHVALVAAGRAGPDVLVADELPLELKSMKHGKRIARLQKKIPALAGLSSSDLLALDAELGETPAKSVVTLDEAEEKAATDEALAEKRKSEGEDAELTEEERADALEKARDKKAKDKAAKDKAAKDAKAAHDAAAAADAKEEEDDEEEEAEDAAEEDKDEKEEAEDAEKDDSEARDRRVARDSRRRARDRRMGARDARKAARDRRAKDIDFIDRGYGPQPIRGTNGYSRKKAGDAAPDHRKDFNSIKQGGADRRRGHDSVMTMDEVNKIVEKAVGRATAATSEKVREEVTAKQRALAIACDEVAPLVGKVQMHAFDSAEEVYAFALEKTGIEVEEDFPEAGYRALVKNELRHREAVRKPAKHALDSARGYDAQALFQKH